MSYDWAPSQDHDLQSQCSLIFWHFRLPTIPCALATATLSALELSSVVFVSGFWISKATLYQIISFLLTLLTCSILFDLAWVGVLVALSISSSELSHYALCLGTKCISLGILSLFLSFGPAHNPCSYPIVMSNFKFYYKNILLI